MDSWMLVNLSKLQSMKKTEKGQYCFCIDLQITLFKKSGVGHAIVPVCPFEWRHSDVKLMINASPT